MALKPRAKGIPRVTAYQSLVTFANFVVGNMSGNLIYVTPFPALATITTASNLLAADIAAWGPVGNRGSHLELMTMRADALALRNLLVQELGYVQTTVVALGGDYATQAANIISSGFSVKNPGIPQGVLGQPENFHQQFLNRISIFFVGLRWKKPIGLTSPGNVKNYQVWRSITNDFFSALVIATTTRTSFVDASVSTARNIKYYYWITASNDAGIGAQTAAVTVEALS